MPHYSISTCEQYEAKRLRYLQAYDAFDDSLSRQIYARNLLWLYTLDPVYDSTEDPQDQYFPSDIVELDESEFFIDCGAYTGDTLWNFLQVTHGMFKGYVAIEPDPTNYVWLCEKVGTLPIHISDRVKTLCVATGESEGRSRFASGGTLGAGFSSSGDIEVEVISIDSLTIDDPISSIKMDVEGAELETLKGSRNVIREHTPKLAVCIYHSPDDLWRIPLYLKEMDNKAGLFSRIHECDGFDVVAYSIP